MQPFFSIIIPTYNRAHLLPRAIQSVIDQTCEDWELIIIDDGGSDGTEEVVLGFQDDRIQYYWQENAELNGARNKGIAKASGAFIGFLDDDDELASQHLFFHQEMIKSLDHKLAIYKSGVSVVEKSGAINKHRLFDRSKENAVEYILEEQQGIHSFTFSREIFDTLKFDEEYKLFDDDHFLIRAYLQFELIQIPEYTVLYHKHEANRTELYTQRVGYFENYIDAFEDVVQKYGSEILRYTTTKNLSLLKSRIYLNQSIKMMILGEYKVAFEQMIRGNNVYLSLLNWKYYVRFIIGFFKSNV